MLHSNKSSLTPKNKKTHWKLPLSLMAIAIAATALFVVANPSEKGQAAPFTGCSTDGFLFKYPDGPTDVHSVDMVTGQDSQITSISGRRINAIGYNQQDNFIYGWDDQNTTLVRVHSDHQTVDELTVNGYTGPVNGVVIGDVDPDGFYWIYVENHPVAGTDSWYRIDLNQNPIVQVDTGTATGAGNRPIGNGGADWAFVPGTNALWLMKDDSGGRLWSFSRTGQTWTNHTQGATTIGGTGFTGSEIHMGAFYADPDGYLYGSSNATGNVWRVNVNSTPYEAGLVGNGDPSSSNDGARCANAPIPIDFGDAPDGYDTSFNEGGPRHSVVGYLDSNHTAPLMLGKKLDIETDGFPGTEAHGDDDNNIDDEESVQHIVATPGTPTTLNIPVTVTNNTSDVATLAGWVDLDNNGTFEAGERVMENIPADSGTGTYELDFPTTTFTTDSYARFRVFDPSVADPQPTGSATGGEVEDYLVQVGTYEVEKTSTPANGSSVEQGDTITYTLNINNTGLTDLINLSIHDNLTDVLDDATLEGAPVVEPASAGTATVDHDELEFVFTGDILAGQQVTVTYSVKVNNPDNLGNGAIKNHVIAAHSNCHPGVEDGQHTAPGDPACQTTHQVAGLANTGGNFILPLTLAGGLIVGSGVILYSRKRFSTAKI